MRLITVEQLHFHYRVIRTTSTSLKGLLRDLLHGSVKVSKINALSNISFTLDSGEILGIIGGNGAGKSTLLKLLCKVLPPQSGTVEVSGTLAPMISLGAGFHPELTGVENTIFYSALVGRDLKVVKREMAEDGTWAGISEHMDFPIRSYSSGMVARLAFSAATQERADIVLIDEVMSVGDEHFRAATKNRILEHVSQGSAIVLVSHETQLILDLCTRVLWLESGKVKMMGDPVDVISCYRKAQEI